jgi:hypothetical protein
MKTAEAMVGERFANDTREHVMTVLKDDGLYRHLRFARPDTYCYGFDIVTWPGYLAFVGDMGDYVFCRIKDMVNFFASDNGRINPHYWSEKLQAPRPDGAETFDPGLVRQNLIEWAEDHVQWCDDEHVPYLHVLVEAIDRELRFTDLYSEESAHHFLTELEEEMDEHLDTWEWRLRSYDHKFLWACYAIAWGVTQYLTAKTSDLEGTPA